MERHVARRRAARAGGEPRVRLRSVDADRVLPSPAATGAADAPTDDPACAALLAEAQRGALQRGELDAAAQLVDEALAKRPSPAQRARGHRLQAQIAELRGDAGSLRATLEAAFADRDTLDAAGNDALLRTLLAAARVESVRDVLAANARLVDECARRWCADWTREHPARIERRAEHGTWYSVTGLEPLIAMGERLREQPPYFRLEQLGSEAVARAAIEALEVFVGTWPKGEWAASWSVIAIGDDFLARHGSVNGPWTGFFVARADLCETLRERLQRAELLPAGVELDFEGAHEELGTPLRARVALLGDDLGFVLRHRDPQTLVRAQSRKLLGLRIGLVLMAVFAAGAGLAMFRALRRERRLSELKASFVANVSHELRTPLASILLMAENLESGRTRDPAAQSRYHALIRREALRLSHLVDDVLDFSRLERGKRLELRREELDPRAVIDEWCAEMRAWASEHGMELELDIGALPESFSIDREALRRALFNLLDNARKHSGSRRVRFEAAFGPVAGSDTAQLLLRVADRGRGIPPQRRASVFEPFERLDEGPDSAPGAGLGLAIVKEIVLAHGGTIRVEDPPSGPGCVFTLRLPMNPMNDAHEPGERKATT